MPKIYKYLLIILCITSLSFINLWVVTKKGFKKQIHHCQSTNDKRIASLFEANNFNNRKLTNISVTNIVTGKKNDNILKDSTIAILLSEPQCNKCQENEMKRLDSLGQEKNVDIIGITVRSKMTKVAVQRKLLNIEFPIYYIADAFYYNDLVFSEEFPQILYIKNRVVISAFKPVPRDDRFSEMYYNTYFNELL